MKLVITYCTLLKLKELYFLLKTPQKLSFLKNKKKNNTYKGKPNILH